MTVGAVGQGIVAGDLVNTASRIQAAAAARVGARRRRHPAHDRGGDRVRAGRRLRAQGQARAGGAVAGGARVGRAARRRPQRRARPAVRRPRARAAPAEGRCSTPPRAAGRISSTVTGHRRASASRGWRGSSRSTPTAWPTRCSGTAAAASPTATASRSGRWPRWCACAPGSPRTTPAATADAEAGGGRRRVGHRSRRPRVGDAAAAPPAGAGADRRRRPRAALPGLAAVLRGDGRAAAGRARVRGHAVGRPVAAHVRRVPAGVVARPPAVRGRASPGPSWPTAGPGGARRRARSRRSRSSRCARDAMGELVSGMVPGLPAEAAAHDRRRGRRACRSTPSRPRGCCSTAACSSRAGDGGYRVTGDDRRPRDPRDAACAGRRAAGRRCPTTSAGCVQQAAVLGKTFTLDGLAAVSGLSRATRSPRRSPAWRARSSSPCRPIRARPSAGQYGFVQDMVRTIARDTLGRRERKRLHLATADHLARLGGDELAEVDRRPPARRLPAAAGRPRRRRAARRRPRRHPARRRPGRVARRPRGGLPARHRGARSRRRTAPSRRRCTSGPALLALQKGEVADAEAEFTPCARDPRARRRRPAAARVRARRGDVLFLLGRSEEAVVEMEDAYAVLADGPGDADLAHLAAQLGRLAGMIGDEERGHAALERAIDIAETLRPARGALERPQHQGPVDARVHEPARGGAVAAARRAAGRARSTTSRRRPCARTSTSRSSARASTTTRTTYDSDRPRAGRARGRSAVEAQLPAAHVARRDRARRLGRGAAHHARVAGVARRRDGRLRARRSCSPAPSSSPAAGRRGRRPRGPRGGRLRRVDQRRAEPGDAVVGARRGARGGVALRRGGGRRRARSRRLRRRSGSATRR